MTKNRSKNCSTAKTSHDFNSDFTNQRNNWQCIYFLFSFTRCRRIFRTVGLNDFKRIHMEVKFRSSRVMKVESTERYSDTSKVKLMNLSLVANWWSSQTSWNLFLQANHQFSCGHFYNNSVNPKVTLIHPLSSSAAYTLKYFISLNWNFAGFFFTNSS